jgi:hypothetical protein
VVYHLVFRVTDQAKTQFGKAAWQLPVKNKVKMFEKFFNFGGSK